MRLKNLHIEKLPGIRPGFSLEEIGPGVNVVVGPNASGKTSLCRAVRALLYADEQPDSFVQLEAEVEDENGIARVIRVGREIRWEHEGQSIDSRLLPEHRFLSCYTIEIDALMAAGPTEEEIGERIALDLSGGFDLPAVARNEPFHLKSNHGREEAKGLRNAEHALAGKRGEHAELQREQERLEELEIEKAAASEATLEVQAHRRAISLLEARRESREKQESARAAFPEGMNDLRGDEDERLKRLYEQRREQDHLAEEAKRREADARNRIARSGLEEAGVNDAALATRRQQIERLRKLEENVARLTDQVRDASVELGRTKQDLGADTPKTEVSLKPATLTDVERKLAAKRQADADILALNATIAGFSSEDKAAPDPEPLREGRRALLRWLSAPQGQPRWSAVRIAWLAVLILSTMAAVVSAAVTGTPLLGFVALPIGAALYVLLRGGLGDTRDRTEAVTAYRRTGVDEPKTWDVAVVHDRLQSVDQQLSEAERRESDLQRRREATNQRQVRAQEREKIVAALQSVARKVGFAPDRLDASFDQWLRLVAAYNKARKERDQKHMELKARRKEADKLRASSIAFLVALGENIEEESPDAAELSGRLDHLAKRLQDRDLAQRDAKERSIEIERCQRDLARLEGEVGELFKKAGIEPGDETTLGQRIDMLDRWKEAQEDLLKAEEAVRIADSNLGESSQLRELVDQDDMDGLERSLADAEETEAGHEALVKTITEIETRIKQTQRERELEELLANRQVAEETLRERLEEALFAGAGQFLLREIEREHVAERRPAVLKQAQRWFREFTRNQFELEFAGNGQQGFAATDTRAGERRRLEELSTGTRMQLLLAVRLAFAVEAEKGRASLPLFLDEVLTTADPDRYRSVAESIQLFATQQDRQVFYLTAQPQDALPWVSKGDTAPHRIDMGEVRGEAYGITDSGVLSLPALPPIPGPNGQRPEDYAVELGVALIDPWAPGEAIHLFHLLRDDLDLLHRLLEERTDSLGALKALLKSDAVTVLLSKDEIRQLQSRIAIAEAVKEAWHTGRGRPVDREAIENSPVTERFYEELDVLAGELNGDAHALLAAIEAKQVKRFGSKKREELEDWFREHRYLVDRQPLLDGEVELRVLATVKPFLEDGTTDAGAVRQRVRELSSAIIR